MSESYREMRFLLKHSSIYGFGMALSRLVAFALLPVYTRHLTPHDYGVLELIDITIGLVAIVIGIGIAEAMSRFYYDSENETRRRSVVSTTYGILTTASLFSVLVLVGLSDFVSQVILDSKSYSTLFKISFISLAVGLVVDTGKIYLRLLYKSTLFLLISMLSMIICISLNIFFIVYMGYGVLGIILSTLITNILIGIPLTMVILFHAGLKLEWALAKDMLNFSIPLVPSNIANAVVNYSDRFFIKHFVSISDTGIYGLAQKVATSIHVLITTPFIMIFMPRRFEVVNRPDAKDIFRRVFDYYFFGILSIGLALSVFSYRIMRVMTTPAFYRAGTFVPLAILIIIVLGMKYHFEFGILYSKKTKYYAYINIAMSCVHLSLNMVLIHAYGIWGALYASFVAITLSTTLVYIVAQRLYRIDFNFERNAKMLFIASGIYFLSSYSISESIYIETAYNILLLMIFPFLLVLAKVFTDGEMLKAKDFSLAMINRLLGCRSL